MKSLYFFVITNLFLFSSKLLSTPSFEDFVQDIRYLYNNSNEDEKENTKLVLMQGMERICKQYMQQFQRIMSAKDFEEMSNWSLTFFLFKYAKEGKINDLQELITQFPNLKLNPQNGDGKTPADYAREGGHVDCEALLISLT